MQTLRSRGSMLHRDNAPFQTATSERQYPACAAPLTSSPWAEIPTRRGSMRPLSLFYWDASADGVEERSLVPHSRSHARLRRHATMSHAFSRPVEGTVLREVQVCRSLRISRVSSFDKRRVRPNLCKDFATSDEAEDTSLRRRQILGYQRILSRRTSLTPTVFQATRRHRVADVSA
ncbi:hypothetical protein EVAR_10635_1 [Eumeta japonica]|uniref:Uncharacterized protein n=1 Tax=Eumeta variegata TaxID=151549 RepID=A0A4C1U8C7_EUMVA|nr:hypothetical protein EVAR_10635_1 [Eumeta japonica]